MAIEADRADANHRTRAVQTWRRRTQLGFFALFLLAPAFDLLRFDLTDTQLWVLGQPWSLGIDDLRAGLITPTQAALNLLWRALLPLLVVAGVFLGVAYRYGRLYCGWLCPHFSLVEGLNGLLHRACGKLSLWDSSPVPRPGVTPAAHWWPVFGLACLLAGFAWAITLLTYLLPPRVIWGGLLSGSLTPNQARFLWVGTALFTLEFVLARHLFCRFGCAVGLFQSLAWMANPRGMVVSFARERARECKTCQLPCDHRDIGANATDTASAAVGSACDARCPMRLQPRNIKRRMFACVQCGQCLQACATSQTPQGRTPSLQWTVGADALRETLRQRRAESQTERHEEPL